MLGNVEAHSEETEEGEEGEEKVYDPEREKGEEVKGRSEKEGRGEARKQEGG